MPDLTLLPPPEAWSERFWAKVHKTDTCWLWTGSKNEHGYGGIRINKLLYKAHRVSYWLAHQDAPPALDHLCMNPSCVRPDHLEPVTHKENMRRWRVAAGITKKPRAKKGNAQSRKTHCPKGHEYTPENTGLNRKADGAPGRYCRICRRQHWRNWKNGQGDNNASIYPNSGLGRQRDLRRASQVGAYIPRPA